MKNVRNLGANVRFRDFSELPGESGDAERFEAADGENLTSEMSDFAPRMSDCDIDDWRDPLGRVSDAKTARLLGQTIFHVAEQRWSPELVQSRLKEMARVLERVVGRPGPRNKSTIWPADMVREFSDQVGMVQTGALEAMQRARNAGPTRLGADDIEISRAEQSVCWIAKYLGGAEHTELRDTLRAWLTCEARPGLHTWERDAVAIAGSKATANRRRRRGFEIICAGLIADGVSP